MLINILLIILLFIVLLIFGVLSIILLPIAYLLRAINKDLSIKYASAIISFIFILIRNIMMIKLDIDYEERLDKDTTYMYISNHRGNFDVILTYPLLNIGTFIIAKDSLKKIFILKQWMDLIDCYFLNRQDLRDGFNMVLTSIDKLNNKYSMLIYPEGTRSLSENAIDMLEFKEGVFAIAKKAKVKIIPIAIKDTSNILEKNKFLKTREKIKIRFGRAEDISNIDAPGIYFQDKIKKMLTDL